MIRWFEYGIATINHAHPKSQIHMDPLKMRSERRKRNRHLVCDIMCMCLNMYFVIAISHMSFLCISIYLSFANQYVDTMGTSCITLLHILAVPLQVRTHSSLIFKWMEFFFFDYYFHAIDHRIASLSIQFAQIR